MKLTTRFEADAYLARLEAAHAREPLRTIPLLLARTAALAPHLITAHPTSREGLAEFRAACAATWPDMPAPTRGEVKDAVQYLHRRHLAPPWWGRTFEPSPHEWRRRVEAAAQLEGLPPYVVTVAVHAATLPRSVTEHPFTRRAWIAVRREFEMAGMPGISLEEYSAAVVLLHSRGLAAPWWKITAGQLARFASSGKG